MRIRGKIWGLSIAKHLLAIGLAMLTLLPLTTVTTLTAASGERTLYLFYTHTNETKRITFRRNGRYDQAGLNELNQFLRDWRQNEPTRMDPALFDLIWQVYQDVGASKPIHVVSAYRSPQTNEMLRSRSSAVAKNSRHTMGMAIDFYIPGIAISKLREAALKRQVGGVGYYPTSGNPFVHLDTGNVRAWPRMTRAQLQRVFPNGRTLHVPSDGVPISAEGRRYASAEWEKCHSVPCIGSSANTAPTRGRNNTNNTNSNSTTNNGPNLFELIFGNNEGAPQTAQATNNAPTRRTVTAVAVVAPTPASRALSLDARDPVTPPVPLDRPPSVYVATRTTSIALPGAPPIASNLLVATAQTEDDPTRPSPRVLISRQPNTSALVASYAPTTAPVPDAQRALQILIERRNAATNLTPEPLSLRGSIVTASLGAVELPVTTEPQANLAQANLAQANLVQDTAIRSDIPLPSAAGLDALFSSTFKAVADARPPSSQHAALVLASAGTLSAPTPSFNPEIIRKDSVFTAPDLDHVADTMVMATTVENAHFAILFEPDESDFNPATELGPQAVQITFSMRKDPILPSNQFLQVAPPIRTNT